MKPASKERIEQHRHVARIRAKAIAICGSEQAAETWINRPQMGLDQRRPIDLLQTPAGARIVDDFLDRLEFGVYA